MTIEQKAIGAAILLTGFIYLVDWEYVRGIIRRK